MKLIKGKKTGPRRVFIYGQPGVGKSTFASQAPDCVFLPIEDGLNDIDCVRTEQIQSWPDFLNIMRELMNEEHKFKWVAVDSVDWLEKLIFDDICKANSVKSIANIPYGNGYKMLYVYWKKVTDGFDILRKKGVNVLMLGHSMTKRRDDPETESFDCFVPRMHELSANHLVEYADEVLFARFESNIKTVQGQFGRTQTKAVGECRRILRTVAKPTATAKNRLGLPAELPLEWSEFAKFLPKTGA
jgi:hypothetical protein